jgi:thiol-disulfide isomerase/thioredoxin
VTRRSLAALLLTGALTLHAAEVPRPSSDHTFVLPDGTRQQLSQYKGKVLVVEFLLVTCNHCQNTARVLQRIQKEYGAKGVQVVGISIRNDVSNADLRAFAATYGGNAFPVGKTLDQGQVYAYLQHSIMNPNFYVPQIVVIDRGFTIREYFPGGDPRLNNEESVLRGVVDKLLGERGASAPRKAAPAASKSRKNAS